MCLFFFFSLSEGSYMGDISRAREKNWRNRDLKTWPMGLRRDSCHAKWFIGKSMHDRSISTKINHVFAARIDDSHAAPRVFLPVTHFYLFYHTKALMLFFIQCHRQKKIYFSHYVLYLLCFFFYRTTMKSQLWYNK